MSNILVLALKHSSPSFKNHSSYVGIKLESHPDLEEDGGCDIFII